MTIFYPLVGGREMRHLENHVLTSLLDTVRTVNWHFKQDLD